jgi:hypothetical protein
MDVGAGAKMVLQKIDAGPYHMLPVDELDPRELDMAEMLAMRGLVKRLPANARFPERFVLSAGGSHATGTFDSDTLRDEEGQIRRARRQGTMKSLKW